MTPADRLAAVGESPAVSLPHKGSLELSAVSWPAFAVGGAVLAVTCLWAYGSTIHQLITTWDSQPDYSHGYLVPPLALFFLWVTRDRFPGFHIQLAWPGLLLVLASLMVRLVAGYLYIPQIDAWSIPLWLVGVVWMFGGWQLARWSLPSVLFLYFMVPLPYRVERWLALPLQSVATKLGTWVLQCLCQPAIAEGHTIHLGAHRLEVEEACSGLRMLVGIAALAVAYTIMFRKTWWERLFLLCSVVPVALAANTVRIAATGLLFQYVSGDAAKTFSHDFAGWAMILLAMGLFAGVLWYLKHLFPEHEIVEVGDLLRRQSPVFVSPGRPR